MSFRSAPALYGLQSSSKDHGGTGRFARRGIFSGDDTWQGGDGPSSQQGPSDHRCSLERQKPCYQKCRDLSLAAALYQSHCPPVGSIQPVHASPVRTKTSFTACGLFIAALAEFVKHGKARQERDRGRVWRPARRLSQGSFFAEDLKSRRQPLRGDDGRGDLCPDESHRDDVFSDARDDQTV